MHGAMTDLGAVLAISPKTHIWHDVSAFPRIQDCIGTHTVRRFLSRRFARSNTEYTIEIDDQDREGERTWRGLLIARTN